MKVPPLLIAASLAAAAVLGVRRHVAPATTAGTPTVTSTDGTIVDGVVDELRGRRRDRRRAEIRQRISDGQDGTYIGDILLNHDSSLARWPERLARPITVWIQPQSRVKGWRGHYPALARAAFEDWEDTGIPVDFEFTADSARAEVHLNWIDRFKEPISGRTLWARDDDWWILDGSISIAVHHSRGEPLDELAIKAITLHEVGHLLGLDHTRDPATIMTPKVRVRALQQADKATARLLYTLPAGAVR